MSQKSRVLEELRAHPEGVCVSMLPVDLAYSARNRIGTLRAEGLPIEGQPCKVHQHRGCVYRYKLAPKGQLALL